MRNWIMKRNMASDALSSVPKILPSTAYSVGDIRRLNTRAFFRCTKSGTTAPATTDDWSVYKVFSDWDATVYTNNTTEWENISGKVGYVADAWSTATSWWMVATVGGPSSAGKPAKGMLFDQDHSGNTLYVAASEVYNIYSQYYFDADISNWGPYIQYVNIMEWKLATYPRERYALPNIPASPLRVISSDDSVPLASGTPAYLKGHRILFQDLNYGPEYTQTVGMGYTEWQGVIFDIDSSYVAHKHLDAYNTRFCSVSIYKDCDFNLYGQRPTGVPPRLVFGMYAKHLASTTALAYGIRGGTIEHREFTSCTFTVSVDSTAIGFWYGCYLTKCIFTTTQTTFPASGMMLLGNRVGANIEYEGCEFLKPIPALFMQSTEQGPFKHTFKHCVFTSTQLPALLDNFVEGTPPDITLEFYGCGEAGAIDPSSYLRVHTGYTITKQLNIGRVGSLPDEWGKTYMYHIASKAKWLKPRAIMEEMPHIQAGIGEGIFLVTMYIAVPPDQLLNNDEFFIYAMGPDRDAVSFYATVPKDLDGNPLANTYTSGRSSTEVPQVTYPVVPMSWVGLPVGWVTQAIQFPVTTDSIGRVYVVPLFAKPDAEFIMCGTLDISRVG